jgi:hypothetical protein
MAIKCKIAGIYQGMNLCKNPQYAIISLRLEEEYRGSEIIPAESNSRVLIKASEMNQYTHLIPGESYIFDAVVSVGSSKDGRKPDLNFDIRTAKTYKPVLPIFGDQKSASSTTPSYGSSTTSSYGSSATS